MNKDVQVLLDSLWSLRNDEKFYFMKYGESFINNLIENERQNIRNDTVIQGDNLDKSVQ